MMDNKSWTGLVGILERKQMDMSLLLAEKADRAKVIDYSLPFFVQKCRYNLYSLTNVEIS